MNHSQIIGTFRTSIPFPLGGPRDTNIGANMREGQNPYEVPTAVWADVNFGDRGNSESVTRLLDWLGGGSSSGLVRSDASPWERYLVALASEQLLHGPRRRFVTLEEAARIMGVTVGHLRNEYLENLPADAVLEPERSVVYTYAFESGGEQPDSSEYEGLEEWELLELGEPELESVRDGSFGAYLTPDGRVVSEPLEDVCVGGFRSVSADVVRTGRGFDPKLEPVSRRYEVELPRVYNLNVLLARRAVKLEAKEKARHTSRGANGRFV